MEFLAYFYAMFVFITMIIFFFMADNISTIKKAIRTDRKRHAKLEYLKHLTAGNKKEAYEALLYMLFFELEKTDTPKEREKVYENMKKVYTALFVELGYQYPEYMPSRLPEL